MEDEVGLAGFVDDADGFFIDHDEAGVAFAGALVEEDVVFFGPGEAVVEAGLDGDVPAGVFVVWIGEEEEVAAVGEGVGDE